MIINPYISDCHKANFKTLKKTILEFGGSCDMCLRGEGNRPGNKAMVNKTLCFVKLCKRHCLSVFPCLIEGLLSIPGVGTNTGIP